MKSKIAKVVFNLGMDKSFDYLIPQGNSIRIGSRVWVEFNRKKRVGIVIKVVKSSKIKRLKPILEVLDRVPTLSKNNIEFAKALKKKYPYSLGELIFMMVPNMLRRRKRITEEYFFPVLADKVQQENMVFCIKNNNMLARFQEYKDKIGEALKLGSVIVCVPLISHLEYIKELCERNFSQKVVVFHSYQKKRDLLINWLESRKGKCLILGTRMALFYYPIDLCFIILEEENSPYYFQPEKPYYNLVEVAYLLSKFKKINLILSADYPSLYIFKMLREKKIALIEGKDDTQPIEVLEAKSHFYKKSTYLINPLLVELVRKNLEGKKRIFILYSREGFAPFLRCSTCGHIYSCPHCLNFLKFSSKEKQGICFRCNYREDISNLCRVCNTGYIKMYGIGIERLASQMRRHFPQLKISGIEEDDAEAQIILGKYTFLDTSLLSDNKFDVGFVLDSDYFLSRVDFEANLRLYIYIKRLSYLVNEKVYVFTESIPNYLWRSINKIWYNFYEQEVDARREAVLPPYQHFGKIILRGKNENRVLAKAYKLYNILSQEKMWEVFGPIHEVPFKLRGRFYYSIVIKCKSRFTLTEKIEHNIRRFRTGPTKIAIIVR